MIKKKIKGLNLYFFKNLSKHKEIFHFVSTKNSGNLALHVKDDPLKVLENRETLSTVLKIPLNNFVFMDQVHGKNIKEVLEADRGRGVDNYESSIKATDAMITNVPNICLNALIADCVPVLIFDPEKKVVAVVHAGRKGTDLQITKETVKTLIKKFKCDPKNLVVGLGPSIGPCCYEVDQGQPSGSTPGVDARKIDLWFSNKRQLIESGILEKNIEVAKICTYCHNHEFFSARFEKGTTGRFISGILLR